MIYLKCVKINNIGKFKYGGKTVRIKLEFQLENPELDIDYRKSILSWIKHSIEEYDKELFESLYEKGKTTKKSYTWAPILNQPKFDKQKVVLASTSFYIIFSLYNLVQAIHIQNAFISQKDKIFHLNHNSMKLTKLTVMKEKIINKNSVNIKLCSPLIVREHNRETLKDMYYSFEKKEKFEEYIKINILEQMKSENLDSSLIEGFSIEPIQARKTVVKVYEYSIECSLGTFNLRGKKELLNYLYKAGMRS